LRVFRVAYEKPSKKLKFLKKISKTIKPKNGVPLTFSVIGALLWVSLGVGFFALAFIEYAFFCKNKAKKKRSKPTQT